MPPPPDPGLVKTGAYDVKDRLCCASSTASTRPISKVDACSGAFEMLNPQMKGWGISELYRQQAEQLLAKRKARGEATPQPTQTEWAPGSMEWLAAKNKSS
jgi:hypothetical protein